MRLSIHRRKKIVDAAESSQDRKRVRSPQFRWFIGAQSVSMVGNAMTNTALYWLAVHISAGHAINLSIVAAAQFIPMLALSRRAGLLTAKRRPALVMAFTTAGQCVGAFAIALPLLAGWMTIWYLCALSFGIGCAQTIGQPAGQMFMLDLVGSDELRRGASISSMTAGLAKIAGPGLAGFLIAVLGTGPVFLADGVSFLSVIVVLLWLGRTLVPAADRTARQPAPVRRLRWVFDLPRTVQFIVLMALLIGGFGYQFEITNPLIATRVFHLSAEAFGILGTLMAVGGIAGSYYSSRRSHTAKSEFAVWALIFGVTECIAAVMPTPWAYESVMIMIGAMTTLFSISATVYIRQVAEPAQLGLALSAYNAGFIGFVPAGAFAVAGLASLAGTRVALLIPGAAIALVSVVLLAAMLRRPSKLGQLASANLD